MKENYKHGQMHGNYKHGRPPEYKIWCGMKYRCYNESSPDYKRYGGRGIKMSDRWLGPDGFINFLEDMGPRPSGTYESGKSKYSIDRIDVNGDYAPDNCRWTDNTVQCNNKRNNHTIDGVTLAEWGRRLGGSRHLVRRRLRMGWAVDDAISIPLNNPSLDRKNIHRANQIDITYNGKTQSLKAWARELNLPYSTVAKRISSYKWDPVVAITTPVKKRKIH